MKRPHSGFTIVELLIVIVIIGILAAITIVAYNGIQERARISSVSTALSQAAKKLSLFQVDNPDQYPAATGTDGIGNLAALGITNSGNVSYQYSASGNIYCLTATNGTTSYKINNSNMSPAAGGCAGHSQGGVAAITNLHTNPSVETNTTGYAGANGSTLTRIPGAALVGTNGIRVSAAANSIADSGINLGVPAGTAGQTITYSVRLRAQTADTFRLSLQGAQFVGVVASAPLAVGQSTTLTYTHNVTTSGAIALYILRSNATSIVNFDVDGMMVTSGATTYNYADGNTTDWAWSGGINNSTSTGPAV